MTTPGKSGLVTRGEPVGSRQAFYRSSGQNVEGTALFVVRVHMPCYVLFSDAH